MSSKSRCLSSASAGLASSPWPSAVVLFLVSFAIRLRELSHFPSWDLIPNANRELGAIAISLMQRGQFADPYAIPTGHTAHLPPMYPFIVSMIYRWFGLTPTAGYIVLLLIALTASVLYAMLPWVAEQLGIRRRAGFIGGLAGAFLVEWHGHGEYLAAIFLALILVAFARRWTNNQPSWHGSLLLGFVIGATFHLQPALLPVVIGCFAFELWWRKGLRDSLSLLVCALGILLACAPWAWRNYRAFNATFFIRSNLGLELRMGNHEGAAATIEEMDAQPPSQYQHPTLFPAEASKLHDLGEIEYMRQAGRDALDWARTHPGKFLLLTAQRIANLWAGPLHRPMSVPGVLALTVLAFWGLCRVYPGLSMPQRAAWIIPLATFPVIYYFVAYMPRYRVPIDWILYVLAGAMVWSWIGRADMPGERTKVQARIPPPNNSLKPTRLAGEHGVVPRLPTSYRMKEASPSRRAA